MDVNKGIHHIRHTRPQWYRNYHEWEHHETLHWITFVASSAIIILGFANIIIQLNQNTPVKEAAAAADTTTVTQVISGGSLTIGNTGAESLTGATASSSHQDTTGDLGTITVTDSRGTGVGWSLTAESTDFYKYNNPVQTSGLKTLALGTSTAYATSSADTNMTMSDTYTITIDVPGDTGTATFDVTGAETANDQATTGGTDIAVGTKGLKVNFTDTGYATGNQWTVRVDTIPVMGFMINPGTKTTISGSGTNVTEGSTAFFSDPDFNDSFTATLLTATAGYGLGSYSVNPTLQLGIPANSYANTYTATVTETVQ